MEYLENRIPLEREAGGGTMPDQRAIEHAYVARLSETFYLALRGKK